MINPLTTALTNADAFLQEVLVINGLTVGVFVEFIIASAVMTLLIMDRIGAGQLRTATLLGGVGGTLFLVAHFVMGPIIIDLTVQEMKQVVLFAGAGTAIGLSVAVTMFRPSQHGPTSRGIETHDTSDTDEPDIEL
jgi:hypothetical protein